VLVVTPVRAGAETLLSEAVPGPCRVAVDFASTLWSPVRMDPFESSPNFPASAQGIVEQPGDRIGPYELVAPIGRGGYGTVWKAIRREPFTQQVASSSSSSSRRRRAVMATSPGVRLGAG
jgi:hypothetical protein